MLWGLWVCISRGSFGCVTEGRTVVLWGLCACISRGSFGCVTEGRTVILWGLYLTGQLSVCGREGRRTVEHALWSVGLWPITRAVFGV